MRRTRAAAVRAARAGPTRRPARRCPGRWRGAAGAAPSARSAREPTDGVAHGVAPRVPAVRRVEQVEPAVGTGSSTGSRSPGLPRLVPVRSRRWARDPRRKPRPSARSGRDHKAAGTRPGCPRSSTTGRCDRGCGRGPGRSRSAGGRTPAGVAGQWRNGPERPDRSRRSRCTASRVPPQRRRVHATSHRPFDGPADRGRPDRGEVPRSRRPVAPPSAGRRRGRRWSAGRRSVGPPRAPRPAVVRGQHRQRAPATVVAVAIHAASREHVGVRERASVRPAGVEAMAVVTSRRSRAGGEAGEGGEDEGEEDDRRCGPRERHERVGLSGRGERGRPLCGESPIRTGDSPGGPDRGELEPVLRWPA